MKQPLMLKWLVITAVLETSEDYEIPKPVAQRWLQWAQQQVEVNSAEIVNLGVSEIISAIDDAIAYVGTERKVLAWRYLDSMGECPDYDGWQDGEPSEFQIQLASTHSLTIQRSYQ